MALRDIRCARCTKKLARASIYDIIEIKCPRCGHLNRKRATSSEPIHKERTRGQPDHSVDGRQAPPG
ncbi:Com family DNA-binding transcriptional regulator [Halomonas caseinilytica]|uniref:Com family DNA-binding transcriptional regulator n=1 Tax=Halomonas caseinilytica TaxID=438744 RepID=UPI00093377B8